MTTTNAAESGAQWGAAVARAAFAGDATKQRRARDEEVAAWPQPCLGRFWAAHDAAYRQAWARLESDAYVAAQRKREEANGGNG